jgi:transposase InsO family protein
MIHENKDDFDIAMMCDLLQVSRQGYYEWIDRPVCASAVRRDELVAAIRLAHVESHCRYGSPNIHQDLMNQGLCCCVNTVAKLMKDNDIASIVNRKFRVITTDSNHDQPVFENTLDRVFIADTINQKWACDITYIDTEEGFLYLAGVVDLFSRKIVGWSMKDTLHTDLCVEALEMALAARMPGKGLLHHSDRGSQYASQQYQQQLSDFQIQCSMSRVGNCWDNAPVESLWASLKRELVYQRRFKTKQEAQQAIFEWIVVWYNRKRRHSSLGYISPEAFEARQN